MTPEAMRLKSRIKNQSVSTGISAQALLQGFMLERLLDRLSRSDVRARLVLKGGVLLMGLLGFRRRTTMDLDATLRGVPLTEENVLRLLREVCSVSLPDRTSFAVLGAGPIRKDDRYGGFRVRILETLSHSAQQRRQWEQYRHRFAYAKDIAFDAALASLRQLLLPVG